MMDFKEGEWYKVEALSGGLPFICECVLDDTDELCLSLDDINCLDLDIADKDKDISIRHVKLNTTPFSGLKLEEWLKVTYKEYGESLVCRVFEDINGEYALCIGGHPDKRQLSTSVLDDDDFLIEDLSFSEIN
jgi:hypothetical protein